MDQCPFCNGPSYRGTPTWDYASICKQREFPRESTSVCFSESEAMHGNSAPVNTDWKRRRCLRLKQLVNESMDGRTGTARCRNCSDG